MAGLTTENWVDALQARGRYTFLRAEAIEGTGLSAESVKKALQRLARRQRVLKVKNYFYVIVPLEYLHAGSPPPSWFIDDLMKAMDRRYYVGLLSAAGIHGASHHQPQEFQVITDRPVRPLQVGRTRIRFFTSKRAADTAVQSVKTPTGAMRVSTPEATAFDLVRFAKVAGQLDNVATVLADLVPLLDPKRMLKVVRAGWGHSQRATPRLPARQGPWTISGEGAPWMAQASISSHRPASARTVRGRSRGGSSLARARC